MSINNCNCNRIIRATSYTIGNSFNINTNFSIRDLDNGMRFLLVLPIDFPAMTTIVPVYVVINVNGVATNIPIQDIIGNNLMSDQLRFLPQRRNCCRCEKIVRIIYGSNPSHFKVLQCLPESSAVEFENSIEVETNTLKSTSKQKVNNE